MPGTTEAVEKRGSKTRIRILSECRRLFNQSGPNNVTTAEIASALSMREGNLHYHFRRKEQILTALFDEFEENMRAVAAAYEDYKQPEHYAGYLRGWFNLMWRWRFFYRDGAAVYQLAPSLHSRLKELGDHGRSQIREALNRMQEAGLLRIPPDEIETVIVNGWLVMTYWLDYLAVSHKIAEPKPNHLRWGAWQVVSIYRPYHTPKGIKLLGISK